MLRITFGCTWPGARDLQPAALERTALEHDVDLGAGLGEREKLGRKRSCSASVSKKAVMKFGRPPSGP